jgi:hypothetical protein
LIITKGAFELAKNIKKTTKVKIVRVRPRWTKEEVSLLKRLYRTHSNAEIAGILGRKVSSVVFKGHRLGLSKGARRLKEMGQENIRRRWEPLKNKASKKAVVAKKAAAPKGRK